jgi:cytochrome c553
MKPRLTLCSVIGFVSIASAAAAGDAADGAQLAATCAACHRLDGHDRGAPPIIGLDPEKLIAMMQGFKLEAQPNHIMHTVSLTLSDDELAALASYLADLRRTKTQ